MKLKHIALLLAVVAVSGCSGMRVGKPLLEMMLAGVNKVSTAPAYADSCNHVIGIPYADDPRQVVDIYYADPAIRKNAVLIDIHGGFYVAGMRQNNRQFASVFLKEGYDVVLVEYRLNDGTRDVEDELGDCAKALDYLTVHAEKLDLNKDRMMLTGDSAGGHLALYMAEGSEDRTLPVHPEHFCAKGVLLSCPAYDFESFAEGDALKDSAKKWYIGPRYKDAQWMASMSPRTYLSSYTGPIFLSTCTNDFIRGESLKLKDDCEKAGRPLTFVDIASDDKSVAHVHNVTDPDLPESQTVNVAMTEFLAKY